LAESYDNGGRMPQERCPDISGMLGRML